jgi:hypothetical protein
VDVEPYPDSLESLDQDLMNTGIDPKYFTSVFRIRIIWAVDQIRIHADQMTLKNKIHKFHVLKNFLEGWKLFFELGRPLLRLSDHFFLQLLVFQILP